MNQKIYQVDAFTSHLFGGNPAAVCPLQSWLGDELMQKIAMENNLSETVFYVRSGDEFEIRWFTPTTEVDLCGHATLASAFVLFNVDGYSDDVIRFRSPRSGLLKVIKNKQLLTLDFPADHLDPVPVTMPGLEGLGAKPLEAYKGKTDYLVVFDNEDTIGGMRPDFGMIATMNARGVIVTAEGKEADFVSRFFGPQTGVNEDPVTGSAHTSLVPYWSARKGKDELSALQLSERKGYLQCRYRGDRVEISGECRLYLTGTLHLP